MKRVRADLGSDPDPWRLAFATNARVEQLAAIARNPEADVNHSHSRKTLIRVSDIPEHFYLSDKKTCIRVENRVYTTYLGDMRTRTRCGLPIGEVRRLLTTLPNTRADGCGNSLIFAYREPFLITHVVTANGFILENGARNSSGGTAVITNFIDALRHAGFSNIGILKRTCVNIPCIVNYPFQIALHYFVSEHKDAARYNESPRQVFFYCRDYVMKTDDEDLEDCIFEIWQNGTVKCMGARQITTVARCFEYLTKRLASFVLDDSMQKLENHFRGVYETERKSQTRRRANRRSAKNGGDDALEMTGVPQMPAPILRVTSSATPSLLVSLAQDDDSTAIISPVHASVSRSRDATGHHLVTPLMPSDAYVGEPSTTTPLWTLPMGRDTALL